MPSSARSAGHAPHTPAAAFRESGFLNVPRLPRFGRTPSSLTVQSSRQGCDPHCQGGPDCVFNCHPPVSFTGDGLHMSVIKANRTMDAVLIFNSTGQTKPGTPSYLTQSHEVSGLTFDGGMVANHSVFARGIVGSHFRAVGFHNALISGAALGYGWINDATFTGTVSLGFFVTTIQTP